MTAPTTDPTGRLRVAVVQHDIVWEDPAATLTAIEPLVRRAAVDADLVVLSEMFATGFSMRPDQTAQAADGPIVTWMRERADELGVHVAGSVATRAPDGGLPTNTLHLVGPDGRHDRYDKIHPFTYAGEHEHYAAGDRHVTVDLHGVRLTMFVCYDLRFADEFWATAHDTDAYLLVANWPDSRAHHWRSLVTARAIENQAWVIAVNRVGEGGRLAYRGDSMIVDPMGETVAHAANVETVLTATVDVARVNQVRADLPFLQDRR